MGNSSNINIVIVTGLSGSGKSTVLNVLEDLGFFCVDNLPVVLFTKFFDLCTQTSGNLAKVAIGMDIRERDFFKDYPSTFDELKVAGYNFELLFLDSEDGVIQRRFSETRRTHPFSNELSVKDCIVKEREKLAGLKSISTKVIDTSRLNVHQLKNEVNKYYSGFSSVHPMRISLISFGFKNAVPNFADLVFDVRFLPNPYFVAELKHLTGLDKEIQDFLFKDDDVANLFINKLFDFLQYLIPLYEKEGKRYLTIAIGCTGGQHRSVAVVNKLASLLETDYKNLIVSHKELAMKNSGEDNH